MIGALISIWILGQNIVSRGNTHAWISHRHRDLSFEEIEIKPALVTAVTLFYA